MTKDELIRLMADKRYLSLKESKDVVESIFIAISNALENGEKVKISGFGTFNVKKRAAFKGRHPKTGETLDIPESIQPVFEPSKKLKEKVNKSNATR